VPSVEDASKVAADLGIGLLKKNDKLKNADLAVIPYTIAKVTMSLYSCYVTFLFSDNRPTIDGEMKRSPTYLVFVLVCIIHVTRPANAAAGRLRYHCHCRYFKVAGIYFDVSTFTSTTQS
jgi:hypothetical protein